MRATVLVIAFASCVSSQTAQVPPPPLSSWLETETPVWIDARFPWTQKKAIERALGAWNRALEGQHRFFIASEDMLVPELGLVNEARNALGWGVTVEYDDVLTRENFGEHRDGKGPFLAEVLHSNNVVFYPKVFSYESYSIVALHEFGHIMGLDDEEKGSLLMTKPFNEDLQRCIDGASLDLVAKKKHFDRARMVVRCVE